MRSSVRLFVLGFGAALVAMVAAPAATAASAAAPNAQDKAFMTANAQTNLAEISLANLALTHTQTIDVRNLATALLKGHQKAQQELVRVAKAVRFTLPSAPNVTQQSQAARLSKVAPYDFDKSWLTVEQQGHLTSIKNTQAEIEHGSDPTVLAYAKKYLPVAQMHLGLINQTIKGTHVAAAPIAPPGKLNPTPTAVITTGQLAHGAKTHASSDAPWLIGVTVLIALAVGGGMLRVRQSMSKD